MSTSLCRNWRGSRSWGLLCWALLAVSPGARAELTLPEAERLALAADPAVVGAYARANALQDQAVADGVDIISYSVGSSLARTSAPDDFLNLNRNTGTQFWRSTGPRKPA